MRNGTSSIEFDSFFETRDFFELLRIHGYLRSYVANTIAGMAIGSKLLSEQPARDRAEHGALRIL